MKTFFEKGSFTVVPNKNTIRGRKSYVQSVYFWICDHGDENMECFPSRKRLAKYAGCSLKMVDSAIRQLILLGVLVKRNRKVNEEYSSNLYKVVVKTTLPSSKNDPTPSSKNDPLTLPNINYTHLTSEVGEIQIAVNHLVDNKYKYIKKLNKLLKTYEIDDDPEEMFNNIIEMSNDYQTKADYKVALTIYGLCLPTNI